jgi:hypothetical protein
MATLIKILDNAKFLSKTVFGDVSAPTPTYAITRSLSAVDEGSSVTFTLSTTNVANGTVLPYTISGISSTDVTSGTLTGSFTVSNGLATATITMSADQLTEGAETATLTLNNGAASNFVVVNDTSTTPVPLAISGLQLWLDAADSSTLFDATAGGNLVTTDGSAVARWQDKSGNNRHAIQATSNARPLLKTNIKNGRNVLRFDGSNDSFASSSVSLSAFVSVFIVQSSNNSAVRCFCEHSSNAGTNPGMYFGGTYSPAWGINRSGSLHGGPSLTNADWIGSGWSTASFVYTNVGTIYKNGSLISNSAVVGSARTNSSVTTTLYIASRNSASLFLNGDISEILIYNGALTTTQRQSVETYLNNKWALY